MVWTRATNHCGFVSMRLLIEADLKYALTYFCYYIPALADRLQAALFRLWATVPPVPPTEIYMKSDASDLAFHYPERLIHDATLVTTDTALWATALYKKTQRAFNFPFSRICKHSVLGRRYSIHKAGEGWHTGTRLHWGLGFRIPGDQQVKSLSFAFSSSPRTLDWKSFSVLRLVNA